MKSKDITLIAVVALVSAVISFFLSNWIVPSSDRNQKVKVVQPIQSNFERPSQAYFNDQSVNPTREIQIQQDPDSKPFGQ